MATNIVYNEDGPLDWTVTGFIASPAAETNPISGDPCVAGQVPGVAQSDYDAATGKTSLVTEGVASLSVTGYNGTANTAIAEGDIVYLDAGGSQLNVNSAGVRFGYARAAVASGATSTIEVKIGY